MGKRANGEGTICKRKDGLWTAAVTIGRDGKTGKLIRKYVYGKTKAETQEKKTALIEQSKGILYIDTDKLTVGQWMEKWLEVYAQPSVRPNTFQSYRIMVYKHIIPALGPVKLAKLQPIQVQKMVNDIVASGRSPRLAQYAYSLLRAGLLRAVDDQLILRAPKAALPRKKKQEIQPLTPDEWEKLFSEAAKWPALFTALLLEWATGMRRSELLGLKWSDIDFSSHSVSIDRAVIISDYQPQIADTKSETSHRILPLPPAVMEELKQHKSRQAADRLKASVWEDGNLIFPTEHGRIQDPRNWSKKFRRIIVATGLPIHFHQLRHDYASRLADNDISIKDAQYQLGHSTSRMLLDVYTHRMTSGQKKIMALLDKTLPTAAKNARL
jgi:integrase